MCPEAKGVTGVPATKFHSVGLVRYLIEDAAAAGTGVRFSLYQTHLSPAAAEAAPQLGALPRRHRRRSASGRICVRVRRGAS